MLVPINKLVANFITLEAVFFGVTTEDAMSHAGAALAIVMAFLLRIALESRNETIKKRDVIIQIVVTGALCYLAVFFWRDFLAFKKGFEIYLFFASLFSVFIAGEIDVMFKFGFKKWARNLLVKFLATNDGEVK